MSRDDVVISCPLLKQMSRDDVRIPLQRLGIFVLFTDAPVDSAV